MKVAIFFPGIGYHCDKPLLYYSRRIASELGFEKIIKIEYSYSGENIRGNEEKMKDTFNTLYLQAEEMLSDFTFSESDNIFFISKSVGTIIAAAYAQRYGIKCQHILYTPLKYTYEYFPNQGIAFIGGEDPWSNVDEVVQLSEKQGIPIRVFDGLNHSLEGDKTIENIDSLKMILEETQQYMMNNNLDL